MSESVWESVSDRLDKCLSEGNTPMRIILRSEDKQELGRDAPGWPASVVPQTFLGIPLVGLEQREVIAIWGLVIARSEDVAGLEEACARRGLGYEFVSIDPKGCFLLAQKGMGRAG